MSDIRFYGTRGGYSLTSEKYMEFGGATTCILFKINNTHIMIDCGSGINNALEDLNEVEELHLFISHTHMDHICGIVTLLPNFKDKKLHIYGKHFNGISTKETLNRITSQSLWPVSADTFNNITFHEIKDTFTLNDIEISNMDSNHPSGCSIYRFKSEKDDIVTAFDFCHLNGYEEKLVQFANGCKVLLYDGNLTEQEMAKKDDWGHSTPEAGARIGKACKAEKIYITHFGLYDDEQLSNWETHLQYEYPNLVFARSGMHRNDFLKMIDIGSLLNIEKDSDKLLTKIVEAAMEITSADGGTLYQLENDQLNFKVLINRSKDIKKVKKQLPINMPSVKLTDKNICAAAAREKKMINVEDCYAETKYDFSGVKEYDELNNYKTKSVLVMPLLDDNDDVIGVLQLINSLNSQGEVLPFNKQDEAVVGSIGNQAAMSIVNTSYSEKINDLLYGFVKVMSVGIDERTPYNANHTKNMIRFANRFFDFESDNKGPYTVNNVKRREILMSIWLHDVGKILTPLSIMNKDSRLGNLIENVQARFERMDLLLRLQLVTGNISKEDYDKKQEIRASQLQFIEDVNKVGFLSDDLKAQLDEIAKAKYEELDGTLKSVITEDEYYQLTIKKGTLTKEERQVMENHVVMTQKLLSQLNFPKNYENIPAYAGNHHEFLNGSGYPNHLVASDLEWPCRLITVCDIFEALVAKDRPYKKPMPTEKAISILKEMVDEGKLDNEVVLEFERAQPWELS